MPSATQCTTLPATCVTASTGVFTLDIPKFIVQTFFNFSPEAVFLHECCIKSLTEQLRISQKPKMIDDQDA